MFFCHSIYFPEIFCLMELPSFTTVAEYVPRHPSGQSQSAKNDGVGDIGIETGQGDGCRLFLGGRFKSVVPFLFLFLYGCDERFVFCHGSGLPPDYFIGEGAVLLKKKWKILLACVVAVTAACAAAWYLLPRPAVGEDYEVQYINVGETLENITGQIDQNTCNALNDLLRQAERRGYRRNVFPRQLREDTVQIIGVDSHGPWFFELDGEACVLCDGQRGGYPIIDGEGLLKQVWALLPEP